jgi:hypothetical protein
VIDDDVADAARAVSSSDGFTPAAADVCASLILFCPAIAGIIIGRVQRRRDGGQRRSARAKPAGQSSDPPPPAHRALMGANGMQAMP